MRISARTLCEVDAKYGITIDVALLGFASGILLLKTVTETLPSSLTVLSTVAVLGLLVHLLVREFAPLHCPPSPSPPAPQPPSATLVPTSSAASPATDARPPAAAARQPSPSLGSALDFWKDTPGIQGRQVAKLRSGRGYSNYVPVPESTST
jgi:hypothetical protein